MNAIMEIISVSSTGKLYESLDESSYRVVAFI